MNSLKKKTLKSPIKNALLLFFICSSILAQMQDKELTDFQTTFPDFVSKKMNKHNVVGANVTVVMENEVIMDKGFGFSDLETRTSANSNTQYPIGSVSKVVTSTTVLKLYSEGIIDIDKPYVYYVPDFEMKKHFAGPIDFTVRHLLTHYAGIPRLRAKGFLKREYLPLDSLLHNSRDEYLIAPSGKVYQYSDWGVDLLALLVQRVTKTPYEEYVLHHIFKPLGMNNSGFGPTTTKGYLNGEIRETYKYSYPGSDGVLSTTSDLAKLCQLYFPNHQNGTAPFLKPEIVKEALTHQFVNAPMAYNTTIGLMWEIQPFGGFNRVKKAGIHEPFYTYVFFIPENGSAVIVCSNSNSSSKLHWDVWSETFDFLSKRYKWKGSFPTIKRRSGRTTLTATQMKELEGTYSTNIGIMNLKANGKKFDVALSQDNRKGIATTREENILKLSVKAMGIKIHAMDIFWDKVGDELVLGEQYESGVRKIAGSKIESKQIPDTWKKAVGDYEVVNYDETEYKTIDKVKLLINAFGVLEIRVHTSYPSEINFQQGLSPKSDTMAIIPGYNFAFFGGETVELLKKNGAYRLKLSGYELQKITD